MPSAGVCSGGWPQGPSLAFPRTTLAVVPGAGRRQELPFLHQPAPSAAAPRGSGPRCAHSWPPPPGTQAPRLGTPDVLWGTKVGGSPWVCRQSTCLAGGWRWGSSPLLGGRAHGGPQGSRAWSLECRSLEHCGVTWPAPGMGPRRTGIAAGRAQRQPDKGQAGLPVAPVFSGVSPTRSCQGLSRARVDRQKARGLSKRHLPVPLGPRGVCSLLPLPLPLGIPRLLPQVPQGVPRGGPGPPLPCGLQGWVRASGAASGTGSLSLRTQATAGPRWAAVGARWAAVGRARGAAGRGGDVAGCGGDADGV